jgi:hypothetical protein
MYEANSIGDHKLQSSRSVGKKLRYKYKSPATKYTHMRYESPITYYSKDMKGKYKFKVKSRR